MTQAFVQKTAKFTSGGAASIDAAALSVTSGNQLVVTVSTWNNTTNHTVSMGSAPSNTWANDVSALETGASKGRATIASALGAAAGSTTVTVTSSLGSTIFEGNVSEFSGSLTSSAADKTASDPKSINATSSTPTTATTTQANELVIACLCFDSNDTAGNINDPPSTYNSIGVQQNSSATIGYEGAYKVVSSTGAQSASYTFNAVSEGAVGLVATYKSAGGTVDILIDPALVFFG